MTTLKGVQLSEHIQYLPLEDEEGSLGVLILKASSKNVATPWGRRCVTILNQDDFKFYYTQYKSIEDNSYSWKMNAMNKEVKVSE